MTGALNARRILYVLAAHPVIPPTEALPTNDEAFRSLLADLSRGEAAAHAATLREVAADVALPVEELARRAQFVLACSVLPPSANHYQLLGVSTAASTEEIRKRWAALIQRYHPDHVGGGQGWLESQARRLIEAYHTLKDPERRRLYDAQLASETPEPTPPPPVLRPPGLWRRIFGHIGWRWAPLGIVVLGLVIVGWLSTRHAPPVSRVDVVARGASRPEPKPDEVRRGGSRPEPRETAPVQSPAPLVAVRADSAPGPSPDLSPPSPPRRVRQGENPARAPGPLSQSTVRVPEPPVAASSSSEPGSSPSRAAAQRHPAINAAAPAPDAAPSPGPLDSHPAATEPSSLVASRPPASPTVEPHSAQLRDRVHALSEREPLALLEAFRSAYERKDLAGVMALLGLSPRERDIAGRAAIAQLYSRNFARFDSIRYELSHLEVEYAEAEGPIRVQGRFRIQGTQLGSAARPVDMAGRIRWTLNDEGGVLRIVEIDYDVTAQ